MSIYATLWTLKFLRYGDDFTGCEWVEVWAQAVPEHVGRSTEGSGYERGDPGASFLPSTGWEEPSESEGRFRAVVFVMPDTPKGTDGHQGRQPPESGAGLTARTIGVPALIVAGFVLLFVGVGILEEL